ncbi:MAG TPA: hypothetical protein VNV88_07375 [Candidatus Solibacter sp.]|nr:hypothetical protein [Candidatus Solibacter sp.]
MPVIALSRILPLAMQLFVLAIMLKRKLRPEFPLFFQYLLFSSLALSVAVTLHVFAIRPFWLMYVDWVVSLIGLLLAFAVLYEVFINALKPYSALIDLGRMLFRWAAVFLLVAAFLTVFATISALAANNRLGSLSSFESLRLLIDHSLRVMQCGLLFLLLLFEKRLGLSWRSRGMAIALGLGSSAAVALAASFMKGFVTIAISSSELDVLNAMFYLAVTLFWAVTLMRPEVPQGNSVDSPGRIVVQRWNEALSIAQSTPNNDTSFFLPGIESAVERILAKKIVE